MRRLRQVFVQHAPKCKTFFTDEVVESGVSIKIVGGGFE